MIDETDIIYLCKIHNLKIDISKIEDKEDRGDIYRTLGYTEAAFDDKEWTIRLNAYRSLGFTEKAFDDEDTDIREEAYTVLGWNVKAFDDTSPSIRMLAYRVLGFTKKALYDDIEYIAEQAREYFELKEKYTKEEAKKIIDLWKLEKL